MGDMLKRKERQAAYPPMKYVEPHPLVEALLGTTFDELRKTKGQIKYRLAAKDSTDDEARSDHTEG